MERNSNERFVLNKLFKGAFVSKAIMELEKRLRLVEESGFVRSCCMASYVGYAF